MAVIKFVRPRASEVSPKMLLLEVDRALVPELATSIEAEYCFQIGPSVCVCVCASVHSVTEKLLTVTYSTSVHVLEVIRFW